MAELLAPAGNMQKLNTAVHFGADAVYFGGQYFGLRAFSENFTEQEIIFALDILHKAGKKGFVTVNIYPKDDDFALLKDYFVFLQSAGADGVIISDIGVVELCKKYAPDLEIHISTQANTLNSYTAKFWQSMGAKRIILARELSLKQITEIRNALDDKTEIEIFVHGAMCISYSGRCLLSNYLSGRDSNRGECVQACRWRYEIREAERKGDFLMLEEDSQGSYILNSKDLNLIRHLKELVNAGVNSFKIEGRMKSEYYVGTVVNSYKRALADIEKGREFDENHYRELYKTSHRKFTTGFLFDGKDTQNYESSVAQSDYTFIANVLSYDKNGLKVMQRNRFKKGDCLEVLSRGTNHNKTILIEKMTDEQGCEVEDAKAVQQILYIKTDIMLEKYDMLRKKSI
ncbi:MAG: U32 family peptidase [Clostridia bacterium]|nr:U32 family peptidase [Clostridia bacterium]